VGVCPDGSVLNFDIATTAGLYSQLTGVLAGFAFTALIFLITVRMSSGANSVAAPLADAYRVLAAALLGLLLTSLNYAVSAGNRVAAGRSATEESIIGACFALSVMLLLYAIVLTMDGAETAASAASPARLAVATTVRNDIAIFIAPIAVLYVALGLTDYENVRYGPLHGASALSIFSWSVVGVQVIASILLYPFWRRPTVASWSRESRERANIWLSRGALGGIVICSVVFGLIDSSADICLTLYPIIPGGALTLTLVASFLATFILAKTKPQAAQQS
jgi:hypothetical protein